MFEDGNVGINQTTPATTLDVNGDITNENVKSCAVVGTDSNGKLICTSTTAAITLISTKTASSSASIQFSGASWSSSYNTLYLNCTGLLLSANVALNVYVGEGAGPTWENGAHYTNMGFYMDGSSTVNGTYTTTGTVFFSAAGSTTISKSWKVYIDNVGSSSLYKMITTNELGYDSQFANAFNPSLLWSYWNNDQNPITGIEIIPASGNIASGTCSLYGMN